MPSARRRLILTQGGGTMPSAKYDSPDFMTRNVFNPVVALLTKMGLSMRGSRMLAVRGRKSGEWRTTPVNLLHLDGQRYLVAPRGETQWARNLRAAGEGELRLGSKREKFLATELSDAEKPGIIRAYLKLWKMETGKWFDGVTHESPDADVMRVAAEHPVFRVEPSS
jgi:deazaflavin-dependent oxidoreductase (nitroreductase family)